MACSIKYCLFILMPALLFVAGTHAEERKPNVLLLCVDDLRPELNCFGKKYIQSPNIDALAKEGRAFHRHYVQAPTCGASRYTLLTGRYGSGGNGALFARAGQLKQKPDSVPPSMPAWFRQHGYTTVSVGKVHGTVSRRGTAADSASDQANGKNHLARFGRVHEVQPLEAESEHGRRVCNIGAEALRCLRHLR